MKTNVTIFLLFAILVTAALSCKRGNNSARYLALSASKAPLLGDNSYPYNHGKEVIRMKLIHFEQKADSLRSKYFYAKVMLSPDFPEFETESKMDLAVQLKLHQYPKSLVKVNYYNYPDSAAVTQSSDERLFLYTKGSSGLTIEVIGR